LDKILNTPEEIKVDKAKEQEVDTAPHLAQTNAADKKVRPVCRNVVDKEAEALAKELNAFNGRTPNFILVKGVLAEGEER
jgi:hypothetical protein